MFRCPQLVGGGGGELFPSATQHRHVNKVHVCMYVCMYSVVLISVKQCSIHGSRAKYMAKKKDK